MISDLLLLLFLVGLSAFFGASETSYLSLTRVTLRSIQKSAPGVKSLRQVLNLHRHLDKVLSAILIGTNLVNALASSIAAGLALDWARDHGGAWPEGTVLAAVTLVMTVIIVMFADILPKTIAAYNPLPVARSVSAPLSLVKTLLAPFCFLFSALASVFTALVDRASGGKKKAPLVTEEELNTLIELGNREGTVGHGEKDLLKRIFKFQDMKAENIMRHRSLVQSVGTDAAFEELVAAFAANRYSQIPVYEDTPDNYVSLVDYRDLLYGPKPFKMPKRKIRFIPGTMSAAKVLQTFRREGIHFAVVADEHGGNLGVLTMKDVLHAVLGRIDRSASSAGPADVHILGSDAYSVPGALSLTDCNEMFGLTLDSDFYDTIAGWVIEQFDAHNSAPLSSAPPPTSLLREGETRDFLPDVGESVKRDGWEYIVQDRDERRINRVWLHRL